MNGALLMALCLCLGAAGAQVELDFGGGPGGDDALPSAVLRGVQEGFTLNTKGIEALERGALDEALALFDAALAQVPGYTDAENNRGVVYYRRGMLAEARRIWEAVVKRESRYAIAWYNLGTLAFHEKDYEKAQRHLETALKENRQFVEAMVMLGRVQLRRNEPARALESFKRAYKASESDPDVWSHYAYALILTGDTASAERILKGHQDSPEGLRMLGMIAAGRRDHAGASAFLRRAVDKGAPPEHLVQLASSLHESGRHTEAREAIEEYLRRMQNRSSADAWILAGIIAKACGDNAAARRYFQTGHEQYPGDAILSYNLAQICFQNRDYESAERLWAGLADSLADPAVAYLRALAAMRRGDAAGAEKLVRDAITMDNRADYHDLLGVLLYRRGAKDSAVASFKRALQLDPALRSAQMNLALTARSGAELKQAIAQAQRERAACSEGCADQAFALSVLYYHAGDYAAALAALTAVKEQERDERILRHIAIYSRELHQLDKAIEALEQARARFVVEFRTDQELVDLLLMAGRPQRAVEVLTAMQERWEGDKWRLFYQLGYAYMELNELDKARDFFERSLKAKADNAAARGLLAFVLNRQGKGAEAQALWERNLKDDPTNPVLLVNLGLAAEDRGDHASALEYYRKAALLKTGDRTLSINIGNAYTGMGRYADALDAYAQALDSPKRMEAAYNAFLAAMKAQRREKALAMAAVLDKEFAASPYARRVRAELALADGDTGKALAALEAIGEKDAGDCLALARVYAARRDAPKARQYARCVPGDSAWLRDRQDLEARIALAEGKCDQALELLRAMQDTGFVSQYNVAVASVTCGKHAEALAICQRLSSRARGQDRADLCRLAGNAAFALKDWKSAQQWYTQLADIETRDAVVQYNLAVAACNLGDIETAWRHYSRARVMDPSLRNADIEKRHESAAAAAGVGPGALLDTLDSLYNRAVELQERDSLDSAETLYRRVVQANPGHSLALNNLGALLVQREAYDEAKQCYQRAVEKRHDLPETYANLVSLYLAEGDYKEAKRWIFKGRGHNPESELLAQVERMVQDSIAAAEKRAKKKQGGGRP